MATIWIPILALAGLILLFRLQRGKPATGGSTGAGCGLGCCGGGQIPPNRDGKLKPSAANKCH